MNLPYSQVDAFTDQIFAGNPAGVCRLPHWLPDPQLQSIAAENNQSETAFLVSNGKNWDLRWFTPTQEVDLCGHATLAAAHALIEEGLAPRPALHFATRSGELKVTRDSTNRLTLDFPARPAIACDAPSDLLKGLGRTPIWVGKARDYLAVFESESDLNELQPDLATLARLDCLGIIVTAPGDACDFVSRFFAPAAGISEDPVTGSAHCTLAPYWAGQLGRSRLSARQISARGGSLDCEWVGDRVKISGNAVTYLRGLITVPSA